MIRARVAKARRGAIAFVCTLALVGPARAVAAPGEPEPTSEPPSTASPGGAEPRALADGVRGDEKIEDELTEQFAKHWQEAARLFGRKDYARAAAEFELAYAAVPAADALYNAIVAYVEDGDDVAAANAARRYLGLPPCGDDTDPLRCASRRAEVEVTYAEVRARIVELELDVTSGVTLREIRINGRVVAARRFPIFVEPGTVDIELVGSEPGQRLVWGPKLRGGDSYVVRAQPFPAKVDTAPENPPVAPRRPRNTKAWKGAFWGGVGLTAASAVAMSTMAGLTLWAKHKRDDKVCPEVVDPPGSCMHSQAREDRFNRYKLTTNALIGVTAGLAMVTAIVGIVAFARRRTTSGNTRASTRLRLQPSGAGLTLAF